MVLLSSVMQILWTAENTGFSITEHKYRMIGEGTQSWRGCVWTRAITTLNKILNWLSKCIKT